jgi:nucleotide-binding universal stress UspA family protein
MIPARSLLKELCEVQRFTGGGVVMKIERILCPTDLTPDSESALRYSVALARAYDAELIQLHCKGSGTAPGQVAPSNANEIMNTTLLKTAARSDLSGLPWHSSIVNCEDPVDCITREASRSRADLIVMRSRRRPHRAALLGSVAESVSRTAPCPVMVLHSDERDWIDESDRQIGLKRVLVAYDFSDHSELALRLGLLVAQEYQAELHLLHVLPPFTLNEPEISWYPLGKEGVYHKAARRLQKAVPDEAHLWCTIKNVISEGQPYREIIHYAERNEIDLVCIGAQGAGFGLLTLFGSNVDRVLRQAPCPVLVARPLKHNRKSTTRQTERKVVSQSNQSQAARVTTDTHPQASSTILD